MARYDSSRPYTPDYDDDCAYCGEEFPRGELAWSPDMELECARCEEERERATPDPGCCEACGAPRADDPDFCRACLVLMAEARGPMLHGIPLTAERAREVLAAPEYAESLKDEVRAALGRGA